MPPSRLPDSLLSAAATDTVSSPEDALRSGAEDSTEASTANTPRTVSDGGSYYVQVASFKTMWRAERCCRELQAQGFGTLIKGRYVGDLLWQRVLIGPYPDREAAVEGLGRYKHPQENDYYPITVIEPDPGS